MWAPVSRARRRFRYGRVGGGGLALVLLLVSVALIAFRVSPWPGVMVIRFLFDRGSAASSAALEKHLPDNVEERLDLCYDPADSNARVDLFTPAPVGSARPALPTVV
jgi:acetyl esterase